MNPATSVARQGPRSYQEDRHHVTYIPDRKWQLLAVMDGHGGSEVSDFCEKNIFRMMSLENGNPAHSLSKLVFNLNSATYRYRAGSTFSAVIISDELDLVSVAILGDSPVVVLDAQGELHVSPEHNVRTNLNERIAAQERGGIYEGGYIYFGEGGLQMSRALGDMYLAKVLSREPEVYTIKNPVWVLVASDGLFDPGHKNTGNLMKEIEKFAKDGADAETLMDWAEKRGLEDNATAVVWCK